MQTDGGVIMTTFIEESVLNSIDDMNCAIQESSVDVYFSIYDQLVKQSVILQEYTGEDLAGFTIFQEGVLDDVKEQGKNENFLVRAVKFLPRLLMAIVRAIREKINKRKAEKTEQDIANGKIVSSKALDNLKKEKKKSPVYKAIVACSLAVGVTATGTLIFRIKDYSPAVEFKDDVNFQIAEDASQIRVQFPFYKIDGIKKFNSIFQTSMTELKKTANNVIPIEKLLECVVTNQARISERDFTIETWDKYYNDDIRETFNTYAKNVEELAKYINDNADKVSFSKDFMDRIKTLSEKSVGDVELISKFNDKIHDVYDILTNPGRHGMMEINKAAKMTFKPLKVGDMVDIYSIDTRHLNNAIRLLNEFVESCNGVALNSKAASSPKYSAAMTELEFQFNCHIDYKMYDCGGATPTHYSKQGMEKATFYKNKGFDLGGAHITLYNDINYCYKTAPKVPGQMHVSIICHEIFHNIAMMVGIYGGKIYNAFKKAFYISAEIYQALLQILLGSLGKYAKELNIERSEHEEAFSKTEKNFKILSDIIDDPDQVQAFIEKIARDEEYIVADNRDPGKNRDKKNMVFKYGMSSYQGILITAISTIINKFNFLVGGPFAIAAMFATGIDVTNAIMEKTNEETMCDMCAAMYKLPVYLKDVKGEIKSKYLRDAKNHGKFDVHATTFDRQTMSYNIAKQMLESGKVTDPDILKYLSFIVSSNKGINKAERILTKSQIKHLAPQFMDDFNLGLSKWLKDNNLPVKEIKENDLLFSMT
jgi:hypothetical protein